MLLHADSEGSDQTWASADLSLLGAQVILLVCHVAARVF